MKPKMRTLPAIRATRLVPIILLGIVCLNPRSFAGREGRAKKPKEVLTVATVKFTEGSLAITNPRFYPGRLTFNLQNQSPIRYDSITVNYIVYVSQKDRTILSTEWSIVFNVPPQSTMLVSKDFSTKGDMVEVDSVGATVNGQNGIYRFKPGESKKIVSASWNSCGCELID